MFFCIHYFDNNAINDLSQLTVESDGTIPSNLPVVPENKQLLVNPNCPLGILLDYVCKETGIKKEAEYDFCNIETGEFVGIKQYQQFNYATKIFTSRQIYVIIFFQRNQSGLLLKYEPYLNKASRIYTEIIVRIKRFMTTPKKKPLGKKKYRRGSAGSTISNSDSIMIHRGGSKKQGSTISKISSTPRI